MYQVFNLHCDLLGCVESDQKRLHFESPETNCSVPQLREGGVQLETLAIATITGKGTATKGKTQVELYHKLLREYPHDLASFSEYQNESKKTHFLFAIENASSLIEEEEPLELSFERFSHYNDIEKILYVSLTWNHENRFGGGNAAPGVGLKPDGEVFLDFLSEKQTAIDLSHTSDALAHDILNYIDRKKLNLIPIASHSNYRSLTNIPRNLPNELAKEIFHRKGIIGLNFVRRFVGDHPHDFIKHLEYGIELGGENQIGLGADFYGGVESFSKHLPEISYPIFQETFQNASCYQDFLTMIEKEISPLFAQKLAKQNVLAFLLRMEIMKPLKSVS